MRGLVDQIGDRREFEDRLADARRQADDKDDGGFARIKLASYVSENVVERNSNGPIGVVTDRRR